MSVKFELSSISRHTAILGEELDFISEGMEIQELVIPRSIANIEIQYVGQ